VTDSQSPEQLLREARQLDRQGRVAEAMAAYRDLLARWPALADCWYNLAVLQRKAGQFSAALGSYQQALDRGMRRPEEAHLNRGVIFADHLHDHAAAERELTSALALNPSYVPGLLNLANLHEDLGRRDHASRVYERLLTLNPRCYEALARYANMRVFSRPDDPLIERLERAIADPAASLQDRASLGFALGRALDACGSYAAAFDTYARANRDSRDCAPYANIRYEPLLEERRVERLIAACPARVQEATAAAVALQTPATHPRPIFVCGMFRSGSTLVEQLLAGHPRLTAGGELHFLPRLAEERLAPFPESLATVPAARLQELAAGYLEALRALFPSADLVTDKRPDNFWYIGLIKTLFPDARIVHTTRDPLDNCLSIFFLHLDQRMSYALDLDDIAHHYRQYQRLMAHWKALYGADIFDLSYDTLVQTPRPVMEKLLAFLKLDWDERCLTVAPQSGAIKTASVWQVREPLYRRSSGRARHYAKQLQALSNYLARNP
jgi:tetratricopeptide (TPR) repeat protein